MKVTLSFEPNEAEELQKALYKNHIINRDLVTAHVANTIKFNLNLIGCITTMIGYDRQRPFDEFKDFKKGLHNNEFEIIVDKPIFTGEQINE